MPSPCRAGAIPLVLITLFVVTSAAFATSVPSLSFEQLTDSSEIVASGQVTRSWSEWDPDHKYIWTHHELKVASLHKGQPAASVTISEPGGIVGIEGQSIAGATAYQPGDRVLVFLQRMPNGYLRTTGWGQGRFALDASGKIHAQASFPDLELIGKSAGPTPLRSLDGMSLAELHNRIAARTTQGSAK